MRQTNDSIYYFIKSYKTLTIQRKNFIWLLNAFCCLKREERDKNQLALKFNFWLIFMLAGENVQREPHRLFDYFDPNQ